MKITDLLRTASSNMLRSKARTILTIIAIFIGAMTLTLTNGIGSGIATYIDEQLGNVGAEDMLIINPKSENPFSTDLQEYNPDQTVTNSGGFLMPVLTTQDIEKIKTQEGIIEAYFDISTAPEYIEAQSGKKYKMMPNNFYDGINVQLEAGSTLTNQTDEFQVALPISYVSPLGFSSNQDAVGKSVTIGVRNANGENKPVTAVVKAVLAQGLLSQGGVMINRPLALGIYNNQTEGLPEDSKDKQPYAVARFDKNATEQDIMDIKKGLEDKGYTATTVQDQIGIIKQVIDAVIMVLNLFAGIALLAATFGIVNTLLMAVQERTKEIGLMKALGMGSKRVFLLFSTEAILLGFWGSLLGSLAGIGLGKLANAVATNSFLKDFVGFELTSFPLTSVITIMLVIMSIAFLAGTLPARRASKKDPIEALRYE